MNPNILHRCLLTILFVSAPARADTHNWNGLGAGTNWSTGANWVAGNPPVGREPGPVVLVFPSGGFQPSNVCNIDNLGVDSIVINGSNYILGTLYPVPVPLSLRGNGNSLYSAGLNNTVYVPLVLFGSDLNFGTATGAELRVSGAMSGTGGFRKVGRGELFLEGSSDNSFTGTTTVLGGKLHLKKQSGRVAFSGPLVIGDTNGSSEVNGGVDSTVKLDGDQQMPFGTAVTVNPDGLLEMGGHSAAVGSLTLVGNAVIDDFSGVYPTLTLLGNVTTANAGDLYVYARVFCNLSLGGGTRTVTTGSPLSLNRNISPGGAGAGIIKNGPESLSLSGTNTYTGDTLVNEGQLAVHGTQAGSRVVLKPGTSLTGAGTTGAVECEGATVEPLIYTTSGQIPRNMTTGNLVMDSASTLEILLDEDLMENPFLMTVLGTVNLGGCRLAAEFETSATFHPATGSTFVVIQNNFSEPVTGTFRDLPEGASFKFSGRLWRISYKGGNGNDVVLTLASQQLPLSTDRIVMGSATHYTVITGNGTPGVSGYRMQSSPDLKVWTDEGSLSNSNGNLTAYANDYPSRSRYFYRFVQP